MTCESGGDPNAVGRYGELGIMQVGPAYWGVMGSYEQIAFAVDKYYAGQRYLWVCSPW